MMVSPITIRQWAQKGMLQAQTTAGGHRRFTMASVRQFASERGIELPNATDRLLIVDDNRQFNNFLLALFNSEFPGLEVMAAYDGFEATFAIARQGVCGERDDGYVRFARFLHHSDAAAGLEGSSQC